jgi:hypothetical protein
VGAGDERDSRGGVSIGLRVADRGSSKSMVQPWLLGERTWGRDAFRGGWGVPRSSWIRSSTHRDRRIRSEQATSYDFGVEQPLARGWRAQASVLSRRIEHLRRTSEDRLIRSLASGSWPVRFRSFPMACREHPAERTAADTALAPGWADGSDTRGRTPISRWVNRRGIDGDLISAIR